MSIHVKFFASLREYVGQAEIDVAYAVKSTAAIVWQQASNKLDMPVNTLIAVNMEYVDSTYEVVDGDEVAFFPPVTGG